MYNKRAAKPVGRREFTGENVSALFHPGLGSEVLASSALFNLPRWFWVGNIEHGLQPTWIGLGYRL